MTARGALRIASGVTAAVLALFALARPALGQAPSRLIDEAYHAAYNLDHDRALTLARQAVAAAPGEPSTHRALAAVLWVRILFERGALTVDSYLGGVTKLQKSLPKPPPALDAEFKRELALATSLAEARLDKNPRDLTARADAGSAYALQASYTASVEGSLMGAFRTARRAYDAHEKVFERDPAQARSGLVVGTYRYLVAGLSLPSRLVAYVAGFGGGKERGIGMIEAALPHPDARIDATITLILVYTKERRHADAARLVRTLAAEFPGNRLLQLEEGSALLRANKAGEAEAVLARGFDAFERDPRAKAPGERALWLYKRGSARLLLNRRPEAEADLRAGLASEPVAWVRGRLHLELGKLADVAGRRPEALAEYRRAKAIGDDTNDAIASNDANRLLRRPFVLGPVPDGGPGLQTQP